MTAKDIKRAIFLDRDGTISPDEFGYIKDPDIYRLYPKAGEALRIFRDLDFLIFIVTNQSGIARGYFTKEELQKVHQKMQSLIAKEGVRLDGLYYAPYHREGIVEPYNIDHEDRKPGIGMYRQARKDHLFDPGRSYMIGDRGTDIGFAHNAGLRSILLLTGNGKDEFRSILQKCADYEPDFVCENLISAAQMIKRFDP